MRAFLGAFVFSVAGIYGLAWAQVPTTVGYNGVLFTCPESGPCNGYSYQGPMTFRLWDDPVSVDVAHLVWEEVQPEVRVEWGFYHVDLGAVKPLPADAFAGPRWLEVQVGNDAPLAPRSEVGSVPYAFVCGNAVSLQGKPATAFAQASHVHVIAEVTGLQAALDGKAPAVHNHDDLYYRKAEVDTALLGKANVGDSYTKAESDARYAAKVHGHAIADVTGLQAALDGKAAVGASYTKTESDARYAAKVHGHVISDTLGLQEALDGKEDAGTCYPKAQVDQMIAALEARIQALEVQAGRVCPSDMVQVGDFCVERYESSIWERKDGKPVDCKALQEAVDAAIAAGWTEADIYYGTHPTCALTDKPAMCSYRQYGSPPGCGDCDDYPADFPDSGNWAKPLYACAIRGVMPSRSMTWFQAQQACVNAGKHLITNGEWQAAVAGTPDPGESNGADGSCNTWSAGPRKTGLAAGKCVSRYGAEDMIGNLWEWVDLWGQAGKPATGFNADETMYTPWPPGYAGADEDPDAPGTQTRDGTWNVNGRVTPAYNAPYKDGMPFAAIRGGDWDEMGEAGAFAFAAHLGPSYWTWHLGARCARGL